MRRLRDERGDATVEAVLAVPVLLLLVLLVIQFGLYYHAAHTAEAAAQEGARAARVEGASAADGEDRARTFMADAAPTLVDDVTITATRDTLAPINNDLVQGSFKVAFRVDAAAGRPRSFDAKISTVLYFRALAS